MFFRLTGLFPRTTKISPSQITLRKMSSVSPYSAVFVTTPDENNAKKLAHGLVERQLAACVNIIPRITSVYSWEGKINEDSEVLMMIKTKTERIDDLTKFVKENHPYSVPEVISLPIDELGNKDYLDWIGKSVK